MTARVKAITLLALQNMKVLEEKIQQDRLSAMHHRALSLVASRMARQNIAGRWLRLR